MKRIAHISDLHFGAVDGSVVLTLAEEIDGFDPDLIVVTGDVTERARPAQFEQARGFLDSLPFPRLVVPGNHDIAPLYRPVSRLLDPYGHYRRYFPHDLNGVFCDDEMLVLGLNTVHPLRHRDGTVSEGQIRWLESLVNHHPDHFHVLAAHHPLVHADRRAPDAVERGSRPLLSVLPNLGIELLLTGYLRDTYRNGLVRGIGVEDSVIVAQASTATSAARGHRIAYNRIAVERDHVTIDVRSWSEAGFANERSTSFRRNGVRWQPMPEAEIGAPASDAGYRAHP